MHYDSLATVTGTRWRRLGLMLGSCYLLARGHLAALEDSAALTPPGEPASAGERNVLGEPELLLASGAEYLAPAADQGLELDPLNPLESIATPPLSTAISPSTIDALEIPGPDFSPSTPPQMGAPKSTGETPAQSMLDRFYSLSPVGNEPPNRPAMPGNESRLRVGPLRLSVSLSAGLSYTETLLSGRSVAADANFSSRFLGDLNNSSSNGFESFLGGTIGFHLEDTARERSVTGTYDGLYRFPFNKNQDDSPGVSRSRPFDQRLSLESRMKVDRLGLGLAVHYISTSSPSRDAGPNAERALIVISPSANYRFSRKTSLELNGQMPLREYSAGLDSESVSATSFLNYDFDPKLSLALGAGGGIEWTGSAASQTFEQLLTRMRYAFSPKFQLNARGGLEVRQLAGTTAVEPVFNLSAVWTPRVGTSFSLSAERTVENSSLLESANFIATSVSLNTQQRLGSRASVFLNLAYENAVYGSADTGAELGREDDLYTAQIGVQAQFGRRLTSLLSFTYADNESTTNGFRSSHAQLSFNLLF